MELDKSKQASLLTAKDTMNKKLTIFEEKILPVLNYVGAIGAAIMSIAYIIVIFVLINGFKVEKVVNTTIFACVNAGVGFIIMQFLKYQGVTFAEMIPENESIIKLYHQSKTKDKKNHSLTYFWITSGIKDAVIKCATLALTTIGVIYIVIKGSNDYNLLLLAFVNLLMFICFGLLALVKAYKYVCNRYIEYIKERLAEVNVTPKPLPVDEGGQENGRTETLS